MDHLFERKYRKVGQEKNALGFLFSSGFLLQYHDAGTGSKYQEFLNLSGRITCMPWVSENLLFFQYLKVPKFLDAKNFAVIYLKFKQRGQNL